MAILKNTIISGSGYLTLPSGPTSSRPTIVTTLQAFTSVGTTSWTAPAGVTRIEVLVVAGGGGGSYTGSGGGAGGLIYNSAFSVTPGTAYTVTVGGGGNDYSGANGANSVFGTLTAIGGGRGITHGGGTNASVGGSGGGAAQNYAASSPLGIGGPNIPNQGYPGGNNIVYTSDQWTGGSAGGGGAGGPGAVGGANIPGAGNGGPGLYFPQFINYGSPAGWFAGGGGAGEVNLSFTAQGGIGGGGNGGTNAAGANGVANTGGGGGGGGYSGPYFAGGAGGSGIVILRYGAPSNSVDPIGLTRYNTDLRDIEVYQGVVDGWTSLNPLENFANYNLLTNSEDFSTNWTGNLFGNWINASVTTNVSIAPNGTQTADRLTGGWSRWQRASCSTSTTYTFSVWVKNVSLAEALRLDIAFGLNGTLVSYNNTRSFSVASIADWTRISQTVTSPASGVNQIEVGIVLNTSVNPAVAVDVWGAQLEQSSTVGLYVPTFSAPSPLPTTLNGYRTHTYTAVGTSTFLPIVSGVVEVLVVGGGGGGGGSKGGGTAGGGGGAGGLIYNSAFPVIAGTPYTVTVGAGGVGNPTSNGTTQPTNGGNSQFGSLIAVGGGKAGVYALAQAGYGGSGGGGAYANAGSSSAPSVGIVGQGNAGGAGNPGVNQPGGGGGGAGGAGSPASGAISGRGGIGLQYSISGTPTYYAGGGGGGLYSSGGTASPGGLGGGGQGGGVQLGITAGSGTANTGGGGGGVGGSGDTGIPGNGGSGIVIVRYRNE